MLANVIQALEGDSSEGGALRAAVVAAVMAVVIGVPLFVMWRRYKRERDRLRRFAERHGSKLIEYDDGRIRRAARGLRGFTGWKTFGGEDNPAEDVIPFRLANASGLQAFFFVAEMPTRRDHTRRFEVLLVELGRDDGLGWSGVEARVSFGVDPLQRFWNEEWSDVGSADLQREFIVTGDSEEFARARLSPRVERLILDAEQKLGFRPGVQWGGAKLAVYPSRWGAKISDEEALDALVEFASALAEEGRA